MVSTQNFLSKYYEKSTIIWLLPLSQSLYVPFSLCVSVFARVFLCTLLLVCHGVCMTCPLSLLCLSVCTLDCLSQCLNVPFCSFTYVFVCTLFYVLWCLNVLFGLFVLVPICISCLIPLMTVCALFLVCLRVCTYVSFCCVCLS